MQSSERLEASVRSSVRQYLKDLGPCERGEVYHFVVSHIERPLLDEVLIACSGNQSKAAAILGMSRGTLRKKLREHGFLR